MKYLEKLQIRNSPVARKVIYGSVSETDELGLNLIIRFDCCVGVYVKIYLDWIRFKRGCMTTKENNKNALNAKRIGNNINCCASTDVLKTGFRFMFSIISY